MASGYPDFPQNPPISRTGDRTAISHREWLEEMVKYQKMACFFLSHQFGQGRDGVFQMGPNPTDALKVSPTSPASMKILVSPGAASEDGDLAMLFDEWTSNNITAAVSNDRIDTVQFNVSTWSVSIKTGDESTAPSAPAVDDNCVKLAEIDISVSTTEITATELTDSRSYSNA